MAEMLRVFVQGKEFVLVPLYTDCVMMKFLIWCTISPEAAVRSQKQAESEDCNQVDIEHLEKILPQLVRISTPLTWGLNVWVKSRKL